MSPASEGHRQDIGPIALSLQLPQLGAGEHRKPGMIGYVYIYIYVYVLGLHWDNVAGVYLYLMLCHLARLLAAKHVCLGQQ